MGTLASISGTRKLWSWSIIVTKGLDDALGIRLGTKAGAGLDADEDEFEDVKPASPLSSLSDEADEKRALSPSELQLNPLETVSIAKVEDTGTEVDEQVWLLY